MDKFNKPFEYDDKKYLIEEVTPKSQIKLNERILEEVRKIIPTIQLDQVERSFKMSMDDHSDVGECCLINGKDFERKFLVTTEEGKVVGNFNYSEKNGGFVVAKNDRENLDNSQIVEEALKEIKYDPEIINNSNMLLEARSHLFEKHGNLVRDVIPLKENFLKQEPENIKLAKAIAFHKKTAKELAVKIRKYSKKIVDLDPENPIALNDLAYMIQHTGGNYDKSMEIYEQAVDKFNSKDNELRLSILSRLANYFFNEYKKNKENKDLLSKAQRYAQEFIKNLSEEKNNSLLYIAKLEKAEKIIQYQKK